MLATIAFPDAPLSQTGIRRLPPRAVARAALIGLLAAPVLCGAQILTRPPIAANAVYFELLGVGSWYSLNYERLVNQRVGLRVGGTTWSITNLVGERESASAILAGVNALFELNETLMQQQGLYIEVGVAGITGHHKLSAGTAPVFSGSFATLTPSAGIRYQGRGRSWLVRGTFMKPLKLVGGAAVFPRGDRDVDVGLSLGYAF